MHGRAHSHGHGHQQTHQQLTGAFVWAAGLNLLFVLIELTSGWIFSSLALISDAIHNLQDSFSLILSAAGLWLARVARSPERTFGLQRASILTSLLSALLTVFACGMIALEAFHRWQEPQPFPPLQVALIALVGFGINLGTAFFFQGHRHHELNARAAFLHLLADAGVSLSVVVGAGLVAWKGWVWVDPVLSWGVALVVLWTNMGVLKESIHLAVDGVPEHLNLQKIQKAMESEPGVDTIHHLHVWALSTQEVALTAHVLLKGSVSSGGEVTRQADKVLKSLQERLEHEFGIGHCTLQLEFSGSGPCESGC